MIPLEFTTDFSEKNELEEVIRAFLPYVGLGKDGNRLNLNFTYSANEIRVVITYNGAVKSDNAKQVYFEEGSIGLKKEAKRFTKVQLYKFLSELTGKALPYGSLTGIRPTKLYRSIADEGEDAERVFTDYLLVSAEKTAFVKNVLDNQREHYNKDKNGVDVYINIPFCPTRCAYCSFISVPIKKLEKYVESYKNCLIYELSIIKKIILDNSFTVRSVYVGGGTPTSLPVETLKEILCSASFSAEEFTVEAGRPDTVSKEMLDMLWAQGVTRLSINPQTFNDKTLALIGRHHTTEDFYRAYRLAEGYGFDLNIDLIAALPNESFSDFKLSLDSALDLSPENITVHTLALKRGSALTLENYDNTDGRLAEEMTSYALAALTNKGYGPYYTYRQKYMCGNLENTGYSLKGKECVYNIDIMEENASILAAGSGAISKKVDAGINLITRKPNFKDVKEYISRFDEIVEKTRRFWKI